MPEMIDKDGTSVDSLAEEGSFFLRFYLDSREGFEDLVADLLQGLPLDEQFPKISETMVLRLQI